MTGERRSTSTGWMELPIVEGFYVYALWGDDPTRPLYIGKSRNLLGRVGTHLSNPNRAEHIRRVTVVRCSSQESMDRRELREIRTRKPTWNIAGLAEERRIPPPVPGGAVVPEAADALAAAETTIEQRAHGDAELASLAQRAAAIQRSQDRRLRRLREPGPTARFPHTKRTQANSREPNERTRDPVDSCTSEHDSDTPARARRRQ